MIAAMSGSEVIMEEKRIFDGESKTPESTGACEENAPKKEKKATKKDASRELLSKIEELEAQIKEKDDRFLRMAAEYDNFRRRSREERDATYEGALADTVAEILPIIDNLERAAAIDAEGPLKDGVVMIMKSVEGVFAKLGITPVGAPGEQFDPNLHNAVMHEEDETQGENLITDVFQKGYKKGNRIIRFAMVKTVN